jgi:hypothetical protein
LNGNNRQTPAPSLKELYMGIPPSRTVRNYMRERSLHLCGPDRIIVYWYVDHALTNQTSVETLTIDQLAQKLGFHLVNSGGESGSNAAIASLRSVQSTKNELSTSIRTTPRPSHRGPPTKWRKEPRSQNGSRQVPTMEEHHISRDPIRVPCDPRR